MATADAAAGVVAAGDALSIPDALASRAKLVKGFLASCTPSVSARDAFPAMAAVRELVGCGGVSLCYLPRSVGVCVRARAG